MGRLKFIFYLILALSFLLFWPQKIRAASAAEILPDENIILNEVMVNPSCSNDSCEWLELFNRGDVTVNLKGWKVDGKTISTETWLAPQDFLVITKNLTEFNTLWTVDPIKIIQLSIGLTNSGKTLTLENAAGTYVENFSWPEGTETDISWERLDPFLEGNANWYPSALGGTPGALNSIKNITPPVSPTLTEPQNKATLPYTQSVDFRWQGEDNLHYEFILSRSANLSDYIYDESGLEVNSFKAEDLTAGTYFWQVIASNGSGEAASDIFQFTIEEPVYADSIRLNEILPDPASGEEAIELYNNAAVPVNLKDWVLEDLAGSTHQYKITEDLIIPAEGYLIIQKSQSGITLNNDTDGVRLMQPNGHTLDETPVFTAGKKGWAWIRHNNQWGWTTTLTLGSANILTLPVEDKENKESEEDEEDGPKNTVPVIIKTGELKNYENFLVTMTGTVVETAGATFYLDDNSGRAKVYIQAATGISKPEMHRGDIFEVTGLVNLYREIFRLLPQNQEDIKLIKAKTEEATENEPKKATTLKSSSATTAKKVASTTAKARAPTAVKAAEAKAAPQSQVAGYSAPFWIGLIKLIVGLGLVLVLILIFKLRKIKKENPALGRHFGDDLT